MISSSDFFKALKDALMTGVFALAIFGLIVGVRLQGYSFNTNFHTVFWIVGAIFAFRFGVNLLRSTPSGEQFFNKYLSQKNLGVIVESGKQNFLQEYGLVFVILGIVVLALPFLIEKYYTVILIQCLIYVLLGLGLNIVVGWAGMLDLGFVAFYAVGAYSLGLFNYYLGLGFWEVLPIAAVIAALAGALLGFPVLRMHGDYLAIVTMGFGEIIRLVLNNWVSFTRGPNGIATPRADFFGLHFEKSSEGMTFHNFFGIDYDPSHRLIFLYLVLFVVCVFAVFFCFRLKKMPLGRAWEALREDEIACRSMGINHVNIKLAAFMLGAMFGGIGGVFFGAYQGFVNPTSFSFAESALIVAIVVLGGLGSIPGVIISAVSLTILPELFRQFEDLRIIIFGLVMVVMMVWRPRGLIRIRRPKFNRSKT